MRQHSMLSAISRSAHLGGTIGNSSLVKLIVALSPATGVQLTLQESRIQTRDGNKPEEERHDVNHRDANRLSDSSRQKCKSVFVQIEPPNYAKWRSPD